MEQRTPVNRPQGNFTMNINFKRGRNSDGPPITGRISTPEDPDKMYNFSAFAHEEADKLTGEMRTYYIGPVNMATNLREALAKTNERGTNFVAIRLNQFKVFATLDDGKPNPEWLDKMTAVREVLTSGGRTIAQGALAWLWGRSQQTIPIPGFRTVQQVEENAGALQFGPLNAEQMAEIKKILDRR